MKIKFLNKISIQGHFILVFTGMVLFVIAGCRSGKKIVVEKDNIKHKEYNELVSILEARTKQFTTLKIRKANIDISINNVRNNAKANIGLIRDSLIAVSILPALGYEAFRILCTKDSIILINRLDKSYAATSFENYRKKYNIPVGFTDIQSIFFNELFYYKKNYSDRYFQNQIKEKNNYYLWLINAFHGGNKISNQSFKLDSEKLILETMTIDDNESRINMLLNYSEFFIENEKPFPQALSLKISGKMINLLLDIQYGQIVFDDPLNLEFAIPGNYKESNFN